MLIRVLDTFLTAVKELLMEGHLKDSKEADAPKLTDAKFIYHYSGIIGSDPSFKDDLKSKSSNYYYPFFHF